MVDQPVMIFHVSTAEGADLVRQARARGQAVFGETCTHYLLLTERDLDRPGIEGAKWMCSPPLRTDADCEALWSALRQGDLQTITSDHAPYAFDASGKLHAGPNPRFDKIPSGMPGIGLRLPLLFDAMVSSGRFSAARFAELTATAPARIYGLAPRKGDIAIGADADIVLWDPDREVQITETTIPDRTGYTPFAGRTVRGWPETVLRRGETVADGGRIAAKPGSGVFLRQARKPAQTAAGAADG
jgi:dihydropyrimidinase